MWLETGYFGVSYLKGVQSMKFGRSRILLGLCAVAMLFVAVGADVADAKSKAEYVMKVAYVVPEDQSTHVCARDSFQKYVEAESQGRIQVELYPNAQLGGDRQAIESVMIGTVEATVPAVAVLSGFEPKFQVFDLPFLFGSKEAAYRALDGKLGDTLAASILPKGLRILSYAENGFRNVTNNRGPVHAPADLAGLKIRTMENPVHMETFRALGANPTPISFGELYTALQQNTVDAEENPIPLVYTMKFYEVQKYYSLTGHVYAATVFVVNDGFFQSLPEDLQKIVQEGANRFRDDQRQLSSQQDVEMLEALKKTGMEVNTLTAEERQAFVEATKPVYEKYQDVVGADLVEMARQAN